MQNVSLELNDNGQQAFVIKDGEEKLAEMVIDALSNIMTVHHTEVFSKAQGKGLGKLLLDTMVAHARQHGLKVIPLCAYVLAQFKRHPEMYSDVWLKGSA